jgi:peptide/nickel transport system permease protein
MTRHILPNVLPTVIVLATTALAYAIVAESSLSFFGVGIPAGIPSWGGDAGRRPAVCVDTAWWLASSRLCILRTALTGTCSATSSATRVGSVHAARAGAA